VGEAIKSLSGKLGENMRVTQIARFENEKGRIGGYIHHDGKSGALVSLTTDRPAAEVDAFLKTLGMHITALQPEALTRDEIPADVVERERKVYLESEEVQKKPEDKREMIVKGKLEKFYKDSALVDQPWVLEPKTSVSKALAEALGPDAKIERYSLFRLG
jgi:elongation factor Ts